MLFRSRQGPALESPHAVRGRIDVDVDRTVPTRRRRHMGTQSVDFLDGVAEELLEGVLPSRM